MNKDNFMKISDLINKLQTIMDIDGDLPIVISEEDFDSCGRYESIIEPIVKKNHRDIG